MRCKANRLIYFGKYSLAKGRSVLRATNCRTLKRPHNAAGRLIRPWDFVIAGTPKDQAKAVRKPALDRLTSGFPDLQPGL
jgi:hypothetical protein